MNSTLSVIIDDSHHPVEAAEWCAANNIYYDLEFWGWPASTKYKFLFNNEQDFIVFSLKWL